MIREAIASVQHAADVKRITVDAVMQDTRGRMMGDVKRLQQVVWNLLANAIKFTPAQGRGQVTVARVHSQMTITVADNGRGIAPEFLPHVFDRFRQADSSITRQHGGLGIGLSLVKQLVELHAGIVRADSAGLGRGATFTVSLPISLVHAERPAPGATPPPAVEVFREFEPAVAPGCVAPPSGGTARGE